MSEALLFAEHGENMLCTKIVLTVCTQYVFPWFEFGIFMYCTCSMSNLLSYCGLVDAKIRASDKDLPVLQNHNPIQDLFKWVSQKMTHEFVDWNKPIVSCIYALPKLRQKPCGLAHCCNIKYKPCLLFHTFFDNDFFSVHKGQIISKCLFSRTTI